VRETSLCLGLINLLAAPRDEFGGGTKGKKVSDHSENKEPVISLQRRTMNADAQNKTYHAYGALLIKDGCNMLRSGEVGGEGGGKPYHHRVEGTACNIFHAFFNKVSFAQFDLLLTAAASCLLASKTHDSPSFIRSVVVVFDRIQQQRQHPSWTYPMYLLGSRHQTWCEALRQMEAIMLKELSFQLYPFMEHPHTFIPFIANDLSLKPVEDQPMMQYLWNYMNDAHQTTLCLAFPPQAIAVAAVVKAAAQYQKKLPKEFAATYGASDYSLVIKCMEELYADVLPKMPLYIPSMAPAGWQVPLLTPKLSTGSVQHVATLANGSKTSSNSSSSSSSSSAGPHTVQLLQLKTLTSSGGKDRYQMILSDGTCYINAVLDTSLNNLVTSQKMKEFSIVDVSMGFTKDVGEKKLWIVTECLVVADRTSKINAPVRYDLYTGPVEQAAAQMKQEPEKNNQHSNKRKAVKKTNRFQPRQTKRKKT